jgi:ribonuclease Z
MTSRPPARTRLKLALLLLLGLAALTATTAYLMRGELSLALARRIAPLRLGADLLNELPDGLHLGLCGAGSPFPDEHRAGPCTAIVAGKRLFIIDVGSASPRNIGKLGFVHGRVEAVFLTHFHSDHIDGLGELMLQRWVSTGNVAPLPVHGPAGVEQVVAGLLQAYGQDRDYRVTHHGDATVTASGFGAVALPFDTGASGRVVVLKDADLEIVAFAVSHGPVHPAVGYRIAYKGRSVVLSGDTVKSAAVQREAEGVDVLVHEALSEPLVAVLEAAASEVGRPKLKKIFHDILNYHTTPEQAAETARDAHVKSLLFNHIVPGLALPGMEQAFVGRAADIYDGPIRVGLDGDFISLPAGSTRIDVRRRF